MKIMRNRLTPNKITIQNSCAFVELYNKDCEVVALAKIDIEYISEVKRHKWRLMRDGYVVSHTGGWLHHLVYGPPPQGYDVDHKDGNKLDNTELNLRKATRSQNTFNSPRRSNNTSGVTGVGIWKDGWYAYITFDKKTYRLGNFKRFNKAVKARKRAEVDIQKLGFIRLNL